MRFIIADTFMRSLARLEREEQGLVKQAAFEFQAQPDSPGFSFHKLERARDPRFWSFRVNRDLRIIVHRDGASSLMLCYAAHHDDAYQWAERRSLDVHPSTGAAQFVEVRERVEEVVRQVIRDTEPPLFARFEKSYLLGLGVPPEWLDPLAMVGESAFMDVVEQLPQEAAERLMDLAAGKPVPLPTRPPSHAPAADPFQHPDAQRRFRSVETQSELHAALDAPWDLWRIFLHPEQRAIVEQRTNGPARVTGGAGTGKSVVALHRAAFLARCFPSHRVLLTTFSKALAVRLEHSLELLLAGDSALARIDVRHLHAIATSLALAPGETFKPASSDDLSACIEAALKGRANDWLDAAFLRSEWDAIVDAHAITTFEAYKAVSRKGRGVALSAKKRVLAWAALDAVHAELTRRRMGTFNLLCAAAAARVGGD
ncbi:MAG: UvrD-helicase domain-containing protein, partial [Deltaproteobacteria bacterium]